VIARYFKWLAQSKLPKLMFYSLPGFITTMATVMWAKSHIKRLEVMELGEELHVGNITYAKQMAEMISLWWQAVEQSGG
jgi:haloalkane dehalogenase